ncbi:MAG: hypothetical protein FJ095_17860 [Deltaproteobacteria bacterium]|nr:hypothetical protein [Deltaproteobacteria bacterium]
MSLRFEDVSQDGRLMLRGIPHGLGEVLWREVLARHAIYRGLLAEGIVPILSRLVIGSLESPLPISKPLEASAAYQLAHTVDATGEVDRLVLNLWLDVYGECGLTYGAPPPRAGERLEVGRVFAEHVFTRLFADPGDRKIRRFEGHGLPPVPEARYEWRAADALLDLPPDGEWLDATAVSDPAPIVFGLGQTDSNQHVNSLVYPELFERAGLRRFAALGRSTVVLPRFVEMAFRKPSFAGETVSVASRAFRLGDRLGLAAVVSHEGEPRPRVIARMLYEP